MIPASLSEARELGMDEDQFAAKRSLATASVDIPKADVAAHYRDAARDLRATEALRNLLAAIESGRAHTISQLKFTREYREAAGAL